MIDVNAYLGHFAFRQLRHNTAAGLLRLMDRKGIERAVVSSAAAITYRNAQPGNEEVAAEVRGHRDRLIPFAVLNPAYADWRHDFRVCSEEFGVRGLRLYPHWHGYSLTGEACLELVRAAAARRMPVSVPFRVEDRRQQSRLVDVADVSQEEAIAVARAVPEAQFIFGNGSGFVSSALGKRDSGLAANYSIEISLLTALIANEIGQLIQNLGEDRILFGSGMPFHYPDGALLKLEVLEASAGVKAKIAEGNARRLLGL
ncbi:MAG: amidohydrolase family protein [Candidatus Solibacter usitatus]|nr:amidohydrolase family protein [Candidatus Solibacter usitatus]